MKMSRQLSLLLLATLCAAAPVKAENEPAVNEVIKLKASGTGDDTVIAFIRSKNYFYDLSVDNVIRLKDQGISTPVINAMLSSGRGLVATQPAVATAVAPAVATAPALPVASPVVPASPVVVAQPMANPDVAFFYQELSPYGRWVTLETGEWCWQPTIAVSTPDWRPYWDSGHWVWTDQGWFWASDYPWGWAAFHYGRWHMHSHYGWVWVPDRVWGPAWVVWRSGGEYCGWAPLPPGAVFDTAGGFFVYRGKHVEAGFDFGLGIANFSFCISARMGEPFHEHFRVTPEIRTMYTHTVIVNHYTVVKVGGGPRVFNHGIEPAKLPGKSGRFEPVHIQDMKNPGSKGGHERFDERKKTMEIYRPGPGDRRGDDRGGRGR